MGCSKNFYNIIGELFILDEIYDIWYIMKSSLSNKFFINQYYMFRADELNINQYIIRTSINFKSDLVYISHTKEGAYLMGEKQFRDGTL